MEHQKVNNIGALDSRTTFHTVYCAIPLNILQYKFGVMDRTLHGATVILDPELARSVLIKHIQGIVHWILVYPREVV